MQVEVKLRLKTLFQLFSPDQSNIRSPKAEFCVFSCWNCIIKQFCHSQLWLLLFALHPLSCSESFPVPGTTCSSSCRGTGRVHPWTVNHNSSQLRSEVVEPSLHSAGPATRSPPRGCGTGGLEGKTCWWKWRWEKTCSCRSWKHILECSCWGSGSGRVWDGRESAAWRWVWWKWCGSLGFSFGGSPGLTLLCSSVHLFRTCRFQRKDSPVGALTLSLEPLGGDRGRHGHAKDKTGGRKEKRALIKRKTITNELMC